MAIEDIQGQLLRCAEHFESIRDGYAGPVAEGLTKAGGHLGAAAIALEVAMQEMGLAATTFESLEAVSEEVNVHAQAAARIANKRIDTRGSSNDFIASELRPQSRKLAALTQELASNLPEMGIDGVLSKERPKIKKILDLVRQQERLWQANQETVIELSGVTKSWAIVIRDYLENT